MAHVPAPKLVVVTREGGWSSTPRPSVYNWRLWNTGSSAFAD